MDSNQGVHVIWNLLIQSFSFFIYKTGLIPASEGLDSSIKCLAYRCLIAATHVPEAYQGAKMFGIHCGQ